MIPFICFDLTGGGNIAGSNVLIGGPGGQLDFLSVAGYSKLGLPGTMVPNSSTKSFVDSTLGLRFHSDSAHLRGIKTRIGASVMANTTGTVIPALSQNDTNTNPHNPMYGIWQAGARGALLDLIGSDSSVSGGNSMAPPTMINIAAQPTKIADSTDSQGLVNTGQMSTLLPNPADVTNVLQSMKRISDAKYGLVTAYSNALANGGTLPPGATAAQLNAAALGPTGIQACSYTKAAYLLNRYPSPAAIDPDIDPQIVGAGGIFSTAEYNGNSDFQKTAAIMKLVINGDAAAGTIQMDGFDYHTGDRATGETRDFALGTCIGAVLQYAAHQGQAGDDLCVQRRLAGERRHDRQFRRRVAARACGRRTTKMSRPPISWCTTRRPSRSRRRSNPEMSLQLGYMNPDGSQNTTSSPAGNNVPNLVQIVVLNYLALHGTVAGQSAVGLWPNLWPAPNLNNTLGQRRRGIGSVHILPTARESRERKSSGLIASGFGREAEPKIRKATAQRPVSIGRQLFPEPPLACNAIASPTRHGAADARRARAIVMRGDQYS